MTNKYAASNLYRQATNAIEANQEKVLNKFKAMGSVEGMIEGFVALAEEKNAAVQYLNLVALEVLARKLGAGTTGASLANQIMHQQGQKVAQYGEKAFPLSEKQLRVIVTEYHWAINPSEIKFKGNY